MNNTCEVLIVGAAAAGLSLASCLENLGISCIVLEQFPKCGDMWRSRYHRLHLHDIKRECHLPHLDMPSNYPTYPTRLQFANYLDSYATKLKIPVRNQHKVVSAVFNDSTKSWTVEAEDNSKSSPTSCFFECKHLAIANGIYNDPLIPKFSNQTQYEGLQVHSANYTNGGELGLKDKKVLIVGFGNSGAEISIDLVEHGAHPTILQRSPVSILPRGLIGLIQKLRYILEPIIYVPLSYVFLPPILILADIGMLIAGKMIYRYASRYNVALDWKPPLIRLILTFNPPLLDVGTMKLIKEGKTKVKRGTIKQFIGTHGVEFTDGKIDEYDAIVYATGYSPVSGHAHFLEKQVCDVIGTGFDSVRKGKIVTGRESSFPNLWFIWGRLQMIRDAAPGMAVSMAKRLGHTTPVITKLRLLILYHFITTMFFLLGLFYQYLR